MCNYFLKNCKQKYYFLKTFGKRLCKRTDFENFLKSFQSLFQKTM
jgi:hypothetical protein